MKHALEKHRSFPYIAWFLVISFAVFVYHLTTTLANQTNNLAEKTTALEELSKKDPSTITNFER